MRRLTTSGTAGVAAALASLTVVAAVPIALGADSQRLRARAAELRAEEASTRAQAQAAVLTLYALESELARAGAAVDAAEERLSAIAAARASARRRLAVGKRALEVSERRLAELVRTLYVQDRTDPLAIVLGAGSLDEALTGLDNLDRAAGENRRVLEQTAAARSRLTGLVARLEAREAELRLVSEAARDRLRALEATAAERVAYLRSLRQQQGLTAQKVVLLERQAQAAERRTSALQLGPPPLPAAPASTSEPVATAPTPTVTSGDTLTVSSVGYSLPGRTASGLPVGPGIVAVDPSVIPLGTRMFVPGYGEAVAADTGSAVRGAVIDLWFPTVAAARRWGRQTVVITLR